MARTRPQHAVFFQGANLIQKSKIYDCYDITDLTQFVSKNYWIILDLDNTVFEPDDHHQEMGGDQWFVSFIQYASKVSLQEENVSHIALVLSIYHAVQEHVSLKLIQPEIVGLIKELQNNADIRVLALTARGNEILSPTLRELNKLGIDFSIGWQHSQFVVDLPGSPTFKDGVMFCGGKPKEKCLKALLDFMGVQPNIVMADDKRKYLESVAQMVQESYQGEVIGFHYRRLDEKVTKHDFAAAQQKLIELRDRLPEDAQSAMHKLNI